MVTATRAGIVAAILAVTAGTVFGVGPPDAYGICMSCHGRDLIDWTVNRIAHTHLEVAAPSLLYPVLTTVGVLIGALTAALRNAEFRWLTPENTLKTFGHGVLVMNLALVAGGCSTRLVLRAAAGDTLGAIAVAAMAGGVVIATYWLRWRATRWSSLS
jgi:hypothetical protein